MSYTLRYFPMQLVFLSPDAEEDLEDIDSSKVYVICGIIDRV